MRKRWPIKVGRILLIVIAVAFGLGFVVMSLWNALIPELFHGPVLSYWQAIGLLLLSRILLFNGGPGRGGPGGWRRERMRRRFEERMASMTPEEREKVRRRMGDRCGPRWGEEFGGMRDEGGARRDEG
jgi:hypothetical protein